MELQQFLLPLGWLEGERREQLALWPRLTLVKAENWIPQVESPPERHLWPQLCLPELVLPLLGVRLLETIRHQWLLVEKPV